MRIVPLGIVVHNNEVLLVHRRFHPVVWGPPGGFTEEDETLGETVIREIYEESGIVCEVVDEIYQFEAYNTHVVVFACKYISGSLRCSYESKDLGWYPLSELPEPLSPEKNIFEKALNIVNNN